MAQVEFTAAMCDSLSEENCTREDVPTRGDIVELLKRLDADMPDSPKPPVAGFNLSRHWNQHFLTSLWYPHPLNGYRVDEIYLRYGKSKAEMDAIDRRFDLPRLERDASDFGSFPAHAHLSMGLSVDGFFYQFVIGPRAWPDYDHMIRTLESAEHGPELFIGVRRLSNEGFGMFLGNSSFPNLPNMQSAQELLNALQPLEYLRGEAWFGLRRDIPITGHLTVRTEDLVAAIRDLFPVFDLAALREP